MQRRSYSLRAKSFEALNDAIVNTVPIVSNFVDSDFNLNEHKKIYSVAMPVLKSEEYSDYVRGLAEKLLDTSCYGHKVSTEDWEEFIASKEEDEEFSYEWET